MKREIKFRGKDEDSGNWVHGSLIENCGVFKIFGEYNDEYYVDPNSIGQYTGLKDRNGKEIYEGDILLYNKDGVKAKPLVCSFNCGGFGYEYCEEFHTWGGNPNFHFNPSNQDERFEIIGNIHDNPELLKK